MPKVTYKNITFDSELEVEYYKHLEEVGVGFIYHPKTPIKINSKSSYYPDFIVFYTDRIEIVETKGYNQFSYRKDSMIHNCMIEKTVDELLKFLNENGVNEEEVCGRDVVYKKIKHLQAHGWVDFDFKNPNTIANKRKNKIVELETEVKELKEYKKAAERYFGYCNKIANKIKLTKAQIEWLNAFEKKNIYEREEQ